MACLIGLAACGGGSGSSAVDNTLPIVSPGPPATSFKILFLGDNFTSGNSMPQMLENLASSGNRAVASNSNENLGGVTQGGIPISVLTQHTSDPNSLQLIDSDTWDFVVLQEESTFPTIPSVKDNFMAPAATTLSAFVAANNPSTQLLLFQTWAHDQGGQFCTVTPNDCSPDFLDFDSMQDSLTANYDDVAQTIGAEVVPVGEAWRIARNLDPTILLHNATGTAPTVEGSYLAACVFYAFIHNASPVGLSFDAGLLPATALFLQNAAARAIWGGTCGFELYGADSVPANNTLTLSATGNPGPNGSVSLTPRGLQPFDLGSKIYSSFAEAFLELVPGAGALLIDLTQPLISPRFVANGDSWSFTIPNDPQFTGLDLYFQVINDNLLVPNIPVYSAAIRMQICP